jgi:hypothetical protein
MDGVADFASTSLITVTRLSMLPHITSRRASRPGAPSRERQEILSNRCNRLGSGGYLWKGKIDPLSQRSGA